MLTLILCEVFRSGKPETFGVEAKNNKYKQIIELNPKPKIIAKKLLCDGAFSVQILKYYEIRLSSKKANRRKSFNRD